MVCTIIRKLVSNLLMGSFDSEACMPLHFYKLDAVGTPRFHIVVKDTPQVTIYTEWVGD